MQIPRLQTSKRLGTGARMRRMNVAGPLCPRLVSKKGKVSGTSNPSNCFTKHLDAKLKGQRCQDLAAVGFSRSNLQPLLECAEQIELVAIRNAMETKLCNRR